ADFTLARIICLADAVRTPRMMNNLMPLKMQLAAADLVLINKCDLVEDSELSTFETEIRKLNPKVEIHRTIRADMDMALLSGTADSTHRGSIESCNTPGNRPASFQIKPSGIPRDSLDAFLHDQLTSTWRIKGWVKADNSWWYISDNAGSIEWTESKLPPGMTPGLTIITPADKYLAVDEAWKKFNTGK
ncbi:MAG: hypothetical protein KAH21_06760, partial [Spirochaetaceae bacterium]|nr:hypothetical protein [Spirochaetaceae bacterium]